MKQTKPIKETDVRNSRWTKNKKKKNTTPPPLQKSVNFSSPTKAAALNRTFGAPRGIYRFFSDFEDSDPWTRTAKENEKSKKEKKNNKNRHELHRRGRRGESRGADGEQMQIVKREFFFSVQRPNARRHLIREEESHRYRWRKKGNNGGKKNTHKNKNGRI